MLTRLVDQYLLNKRAGEARKHNKFRVSDAGRCHLYRYWKRLGKPISDIPDDRTYRVFEVGHVFHRWIQDVLRETGYLIASEMRIEDDERVGHIDALVRDDNGRVILYDFKTVHSKKFHYRRQEGLEDKHYMMQAMTYAMMMPLYPDDIRLVYISKDDLCIEEVSVSKSYTERVIEDWESLIFSWRTKTEPEPNPMIWECGYCVYKTTCENEKRS